MAAIIIGVGVYAWTLDSNLNGERSVTSAYSSGAGEPVYRRCGGVRRGAA